jgi:hypothetical protein
MAANFDLHCLFLSFRGQCSIFKLLGCFVLLHLCTQCGCYRWIIHFFHCHPPRVVARNPLSPTPWDLHDNICFTFYDGYTTHKLRTFPKYGAKYDLIQGHLSWECPLMEAFPYFKKIRTIKFVEERKELMQARRITKDCWKKIVRNLWRI